MGPLLLKNIIDELNEELKGGIVSKIHQSDERNILLKIFIRGRDYKLLISAHHRFARMHLTEREFKNPSSPLRFCAYLRSRITNARVEGFTQVDNERIARVLFKKKEDDSFETFTLVCEFTGKSSNLILVDEREVVLDALKYFPPELSFRTVSPGSRLEPLPPTAHEHRDEAVEKAPGETWNQAADRFYSALLDEESFRAAKQNIKKGISDAEKRLRKKLENLNNDKKRAEAELDHYKLGELLTYNLHLIKKGMKEAGVIDYTVDPPATVTVRLDEKLSPRENAEKYFKRAKKAKVALGLLKGRLPAVEEELEYMEELKYEWEEAKSLEDFEDVRHQLARGGYIKVMEKIIEKTAERAEPVRRYTSSEGFEILCGKSGAGNDLIVQKLSSNEDIWFHVHHLPGSHVLIKVAGRAKELTKKTIEEAAGLAAYYSKAQNAGKVEVIYSEARNVKKPRGAKPGLVTVKEYKSILVKPRLMEEEE